MIKEILQNQTLIERFLKFCVVGGSGVVVDFGITYLAKELLKLNKYVANSLGFVCAATSNYILNRMWTFASNDPDIVMQYIRFFGFSLVGLAINNFVIYLLHGRAKWNFYFVKLIATGVVTFWNFCMNYIFTFQ
jgi:putative flippase GtrA